MSAVIFWLAGTVGILVAGLPLSVGLLRALTDIREEDRGALALAFAFPVALLPVLYAAWVCMIVSPHACTSVFFWIAIGLEILLGWAVWGRATWRALREDARGVMGVLAVFLVVGGIWWGIRAAGNSEFLAIGEHVMNLGFAQMFAREGRVPPANPFFAGHAVDFYYYYFALIIHALAAITRLPLSVAYFLMGVTWPALVAAQVYALTRVWARRWWTPALAVGLYMFVGNGGIFLQLAAEAGWFPAHVLRYLSLTYTLHITHRVHIPPQSDLWWFFPTRLIPEPNQWRYVITEFPMFSFLLGDLHPHVVVLPWSLLGILTVSTARVRTWSQTILVAFLLGTIGVINSWSLPVMLLLLGMFLWRERPLREALIRGLAVGILAVAFFLPYYLGLHSPIVAYRVGLFATPLLPWTLHWAPFILPLLFTLAWILPGGGRGAILTVGIGALVVLGGCSVGGCLAGGLAFAILLVILGKRRRQEDPTLVFLAVWLALNLLVEVFYLEDFWGGRYNTIFKVYFEAWTLAAIATALAVDRFPRSWRVASLVGGAAGLVYTMSVFLFLLPHARMVTKPVHLSWLPAAYTQGDRAAVLHRLSQHGDVRRVLEGETMYPVGPVQEGLIELAQQDERLLLWYPDRLPQVGRNPVAREAFFRTRDEGVRRGILDAYGVDAIIIGPEERRLYGYDVDFSLAALGVPVDHQGGVIAYRVASPGVCFAHNGRVRFSGGDGEVELLALHIGRGRGIDGRDVLALYEVWKVRRGNPAAMSVFVHFLDAEGRTVAQADHSLGLWETRWQDPETQAVYGVHWTSLPPDQPVARVRLGVWLPTSGDHFQVAGDPDMGSRVRNVGQAIEIQLLSCP
ncbi:MAG: hypothetical protein GXO55_02520 [Chloroflexi bacterium]|nr:hypothetical protein [Chloroflexota bacterium]